MEIVSNFCRSLFVCSSFFRPTVKIKSIQKHLEVCCEISQLLSGVFLCLRKNGSKPITVLILFDLLPSHGEIGWNKTPNRSSSLDAGYEWRHNYMGVSENSGFSPQIIHFNRVFHYKPSILGSQFFWKHPYNLVGGFSPTHLKNMRTSNWIMKPRKIGVKITNIWVAT